MLSPLRSSRSARSARAAAGAMSSAAIIQWLVFMVPSLRVRVSAGWEPSGAAAVKDLGRGDFVGGSAQMSSIVRPGQQREEPGALLGVAGEGKGRLGRQQVEVRAQRALGFHQRLRLVRERGARAGQLLDVAGEVEKLPGAGAPLTDEAQALVE